MDCIQDNPYVNELFKEIFVVYNATDFFIHNGKDTLVVLVGNFPSVDITEEELISSSSDKGTHIIASAETMDIALEAFNHWYNVKNNPENVQSY